MMLLLRILAGAGLLLAAVAFAGNDECSEIDKLRANYREQEFIALDFVEFIHSDVFETVDTLTGSVYAGWEGRFRLTMPGRILVSNGVLYWSYSAENEQVLIDSVAKRGSWDPLTLLYDPEQVYRCRREETRRGLIEFDMAAVDSATIPLEFMLYVQAKTYNPEKLVYYDDNNSRVEVVIRNFARLSHLSDSLFNFRPGPGVEVIEMP